MATSEIVKLFYRSIVPTAVRDSQAVSQIKKRLLGHNWVYSAQYYQSDIEGPAVRSAGLIANSIQEELQPESVVDVGCGTGALLEAFKARGCHTFGLEFADAALEFCRRRGLDVLKFDLESDDFDERTFDVAISMEVAEHLPKSIAPRFVNLLARLAPTIIFTAAPPGQGGTDHVNEQPRSYWIGIFRDCGCRPDEELANKLRIDWRTAGTIEPCYYENLMVFRQDPAHQ